MNDTPNTYPTWEKRYHAAAGIMDEAYGWARGIDPDDDAAVLAWARAYLPRIMRHGETDVLPAEARS